MKQVRIFLLFTLVLFLGIAFIGMQKKRQKEAKLVEVKTPQTEAPIAKEVAIKEKTATVEKPETPDPYDHIDLVRKFFSKGSDKFPIVETISYRSRVDWIEGRPAWLADYAAHFQTSRHFIARSLNGRADYETQKVASGDRFNVFRADRPIEFYFLVDLSKCTLDFYYLDHKEDERVFVKRYKVGVGRKDERSPSGSLTPVGKYRLGEKIGIYKPKMQHFFQNQKVEMIRVFGTRWMPFSEEVGECSDGAKGYGIHGIPCQYNEQTEQMEEESETATGYTSDGCIRLARKDIEELFAIVITKPTIVEIVKDKSKVRLPMTKEGHYEDKNL